MAISLTTSFPALIFTSALHQVQFTTDDSSVSISLKVDADTLLQTTLYAYDGTATLYDIRDVIEQYMLARDKVCATVTLSYGDSTTHFKALYCSHRIDIDALTFACTQFLTTMPAKRTTAHSIEPLGFIEHMEQQELKAHCVWLSKAGVLSVGVITLSVVGDGEHSYYPSTLSISYDAIAAKLGEAGHNVSKLLAYTIVLGERKLTYYVVDSRGADVEFTFRNCFNAPECITLRAVTTAKTQVEREIALVGSIARMYDQSTTKYYEVETAPLTEDEARWVEQLCISPKVMRGEDAVIITDSTCEMTDSNSELNRIKLTWRYADNRPHVAVMTPPDERTHTDQFDFQFN